MNIGKWILRIIGATCLIIGMYLAYAAEASKKIAMRGGHDLMPLLFPGICFIVLGIFLLLLNRVAFVVFITITIAFAGVIFVESLLHGPLSYTLINILFALVFAGAGGLAIWSWKRLRK